MALPLILTQAQFVRVGFGKKSSVHVPGRTFHSLTYRISGTITVDCPQIHLISPPQSLTWVPAGQDYDTEILEGGEMLLLRLSALPGQARPPEVLHPASPLTFRNLFERACTHYAAAGCDYASMAFAYDILREAEAPGSAPLPDPAMRRVKEWLDARITESGLRIGELAALYGTSEVYFRRRFRELYGVSPCEYILRGRMEFSRQLLSTGLYTVTEAATRSGFESIAYFSAQFHRRCGMTPREYALTAQSGREAP